MEDAGVSKVLASGSCLEKHAMLRRAVEMAYPSAEFARAGDSCVGAALFVKEATT